MIKSCAWILDSDEECGERTEGNTMFCATHNRTLRKEAETSRKQSEKRAALLEKAKNQKPKKAISRNPKDWSNTFLCSDGTRVTQAEIKEKLSLHYSVNGPKSFVCEGCRKSSLFRGVMMTHAHIIPQARCKQIGKTELIWDRNNWFYGCNNCNLAIENPKGKAWKGLKNIDKCLAFIKLHDPELFTKFELSAVNQEKEII